MPADWPRQQCSRSENATISALKKRSKEVQESTRSSRRWKRSSEVGLAEDCDDLANVNEVRGSYSEQKMLKQSAFKSTISRE